MSFQAGLYNAGTGGGGAGSGKSLIVINAQSQVRSAATWLTNNEANSSIESFTANRGTGADPVWSWQDSLFLIPAGVKIKAINIDFRISTSDVINSLEFRAAVKSATAYPYDSLGELVISDIFSSTYTYPNDSGATSTDADNAQKIHSLSVDIDHESSDSITNFLFAMKGTRDAGTTNRSIYFDLTVITE